MAIKAIKDLTNALQIKPMKNNDEFEFEALERLKKMVISKLTATPKENAGSNLYSSPLVKEYQPPRVRETTQDALAFNTRSSAIKTDLVVAMCMVKQENQSAITEYANLAVLHPDTGLPMKYRQLINHPDTKIVWNHSSANEFGRLAQGIGGRIKGTDTIRFIRKDQVPTNRLKDVTYGKFVCEMKPNKAEIHRTRLTVGGDKVNYPYEVGTPTAEMLLVKTHINSVISTPNARYMALDVNNFYLEMPMNRPEYAKIKLSSTNTTSATLQLQTDMFTSRSTKACMGYPKQAYLRKSC
jgi:hypothetical protein